jgi:hypothetical protein
MKRIFKYAFSDYSECTHTTGEGKLQHTVISG